MPLPSFDVQEPDTGPRTLNRSTAAARLGLQVAHVDKMVRAGMLGLPITAQSVDALLGRAKLRVIDGELTVLRTDARRDADRAKYPNETRRWMGFHVDHSDPELEETSLRWWRSDPDRVLDNQLFVVTVAQFPVAVYRIEGQREGFTRPGEDTPRHHYEGTLLARVTAGMIVTLKEPMPGHLRPRVRHIMDSIVSVSSGGPIGYLGPGGRVDLSGLSSVAGPSDRQGGV